jgi:hypothetical protein
VAKRVPGISARATPITFIQRSRQMPSEEKAMYHNVLGAGRSGVIREFFNVNDTESLALRDGLSTLVAARLKA